MGLLALCFRWNNDTVGINENKAKVISTATEFYRDADGVASYKGVLDAPLMWRVPIVSGRDFKRFEFPTRTCEESVQSKIVRLFRVRCSSLLSKGSTRCELVARSHPTN